MIIDELKETLTLLRGAGRNLPAHYTKSGNRSATFCIEFEPLKEDLDTEMAHESYYSLTRFVPVTNAPTDLHWRVLLKLGEDCMAGSFILTTLGKPSDTFTLVRELRKDITSLVNELAEEEISDEWYTQKSSQDYLHYCMEYGTKRALVFNMS
ncbi:MAG: hypothetical protein DWQ44_11365 [Bacteroidetes bacterium]|nr:MAG: hypothetical protein DWQ33_09485 [Bacteroidota bacterium]REK05220.1 MAG: hypothetical protein DWQ39_08495 [Bacteroidota bacterium]REK32625.1 MAG: hypothetical protein DWQ44_11365 [Bacteroidota bacterium]REK48928.1 MAG: hypothetical protein DWQ48_08595 [Bacteroidota bacterium]